jgi:hypothetical protein
MSGLDRGAARAGSPANVKVPATTAMHGRTSVSAVRHNSGSVGDLRGSSAVASLEPEMFGSCRGAFAAHRKIRKEEVENAVSNCRPISS